MKLEDLRKHIDEIDDKLFDLLQERLKLVGQVGKLKKSNSSKQYIIRPGREAQKVKRAFTQAKRAGHNSKISTAIASIWREIICLSINFEEEAKIAFNKKDKEALWMLREYFGPYSEKIPADSDASSLKLIQNNKANIAAFSIEKKPKTKPWWLALSEQSELAVFASAPLFPIKGSEREVVLVSNVTPEPCGEDRFLYVVSGKLPKDEKDTFEVLAEYKGNLLVSSEEFYNNYQSRLKARYIGCTALFSF